MHPALRKGPFFLQKTPPIFHFFATTPPIFYFFNKKHPPISFPAYGPEHMNERTVWMSTQSEMSTWQEARNSAQALDKIHKK